MKRTITVKPIMRWHVCAAIVIAAACLAGCGDTAAVTKTVTVERFADAKPPSSLRNTAPTQTATTARRDRPAAGFARCDANITAKRGTTTCAFAANAFYEYWKSDQASRVRAYSPAVGRFFSVRCSGDGEQVECATDDGGVARFPQLAVDRYSQSQADAYAKDHDVGTPASEGGGTSAPEPSSSADETSNCDPNYEGACLEPNAGDYDCEGGSGDGPNYTGEVTVVGSDVFDLVRDGDGIGCD